MPSSLSIFLIRPKGIKGNDAEYSTQSPCQYWQGLYSLSCHSYCQAILGGRNGCGSLASKPVNRGEMPDAYIS